MSTGSYAVKSFSVSIEKFRDGSADATVWAHLSGGVTRPVYSCRWPSGAPTPHQFELLLAAADNELQLLVLTECGVQGTLLAEGPSSRF